MWLHINTCLKNELLENISFDGSAAFWLIDSFTFTRVSVWAFFCKKDRIVGMRGEQKKRKEKNFRANIKENCTLLIDYRSACPWH